jgi:hypothetical protein
MRDIAPGPMRANAGDESSIYFVVISTTSSRALRCLLVEGVRERGRHPVPVATNAIIARRAHAENAALERRSKVAPKVDTDEGSLRVS